MQYSDVCKLALYVPDLYHQKTEFTEKLIEESSLSLSNYFIVTEFWSAF